MREASPETEPKLAVIVVAPVPALVATPCLPITATLAFKEVQFTCFVRSCMVLSLKLPVAVNDADAPKTMEEFAGVTAIEMRVAFVTVKFAEPKTEPKMAMIVVVPGPWPAA